jgi:hypothetical protein
VMTEFEIRFTADQVTTEVVVVELTEVEELEDRLVEMRVSDDLATSYTISSIGQITNHSYKLISLLTTIKLPSLMQRISFREKLDFFQEPSSQHKSASK